MNFWNGDIKDFPKQYHGGGLAIGNFDGMHYGHRYIIKELDGNQQYANQPKILLSFIPHPRQYFNPNLKNLRISNDQQRCQWAKKLNINAFVTIDFNEALQQMTSEFFEQEILCQQLNISYIVVGNDFHYGYQRQGNVETLSKNKNFKTIILDKYRCRHDGDNITSSSLIRDYIANGDMAKAKLHLGYDFTLNGQVIKGDQEAATLGYPTANIALNDYILPKFGVYAMRVIEIDGKECDYSAGGYIAEKPSLHHQVICETHIFDQNIDLYGKNISVALCEFIRPPVDFKDLDTTIKQIGADFTAIRQKIC